MGPAAPARSPNFYARIAGFIYLFAMALAIFSQSYILGKIVVPGDAAATAHGIVAAAGLVRLGVALDVITFVTDVVIRWAFYELLKSVDRSLALLGVFLRISDAAILATVTLSGLMTLRVLSGVDYLRLLAVQVTIRTEAAGGLGDFFLFAPGDWLAGSDSVPVVRG